MSSTFKRLIIGLGVIIVIIFCILAQQIRTAWNITLTPSNMPLISEIPVAIATTSTDPLLGNPGAPLTVTTFFDLTDKNSLAQYQIISDFVKQHPTAVRLLWKDFPGKAGWLSNPPLAHLATFCAGRQNKFWQFVDGMVAAKGSSSDSTLMKIATSIGLNIATWQTCLQSTEAANAVATNIYIAHSLSLPKAPIIFINNKLLNPDDQIDLASLLKTFTSP